MSNSRGRRFSLEEKQSGYIAIALAGDNCEAARRALNEQGLDVSVSTLKNWKREADSFEVRQKHLAEIRSRLAARNEEVASLAIDRVAELLEDFDKASLKPAEVAGAARNFSTTAGIHQQHANLLRDQPTQIVHQIKTVDELDAAFRERFGDRWDAESTAEEIPDNRAQIGPGV